MKGFLLVVIVATSIAATVAEYKTYEGYKLYKVWPQSQRDDETLSKLEKIYNLDFWKKPRSRNDAADVMVPPVQQGIFEITLRKNNIKFDVSVENLAHVVRKNLKSAPQLKEGELTFEHYMTHAQINSYLENLAQKYPKIVTLENIGKSYEGRPMNLVRISNGNSSSPTIFIDAGIHAREWIASPVALYAINQIVENVTNSHLCEQINWIILPSLNPDGYEYSRTQDRFWRKTRSPGERCNGVDANRNFGFHWMEDGADSEECSDAYGGPKAFSEVEARNLRDFLLKNNDTIQVYLTFHSYGPYVLYPWGYANGLPDPENVEELAALGNAFAKSIQDVSVTGTKYDVGNSAEMLYPAAGASDDWSKGVAGIPLVYTVELPPGGDAGFDLPESDIRNVVEETFEGIRTVHRHLLNRYVL